MGHVHSTTDVDTNTNDNRIGVENIGFDMRLWQSWYSLYRKQTLLESKHNFKYLIELVKWPYLFTRQKRTNSDNQQNYKKKYIICLI